VVGDGPGRPGVPLLRPGAAYPAPRFSGAPACRATDALGGPSSCPDAHGPGAGQDLLLSNSTDQPLLRRLLFPARSFARGVVFHRPALRAARGAGGGVAGSGAHRNGRSSGGIGRSGGALAELRAAASGLGLELRTAGTLGPSQRLATLTVGQPLSVEQTEALQFNPWATGPGIRPSGWLNLLRDVAYRASQRGRQG
jgi:hypothetical protein